MQSYDAHQPSPLQPVEFTVAGTGQLPREGGQGSQSDSGASPQQTAGGERPGGGLGVPVDPEDSNAPLSKYKWWIVGGLGVILAAGAGVMLKSTPATARAGTGTVGTPAAYPVEAGAVRSAQPTLPDTPASGGTNLLQTLKDELFELETDRLAGRLTTEQYAEQKAAFDVVLKRALSRIDS